MMPALRRKTAGDSVVVLDQDVDGIYRMHAAAVATWVRNLAGPSLRVDDQDLVHDIFMVVQRQLPTFRGDAKVTTWLYRITQNVVSTARRKDRGRRWIGRLRRTEMGLALAGTAAAPGEEMERQQEARLLYQALDSLPDKYRSLLILFEVEAMTGEEISSLTGIAHETVRVRLHRARKLFLKALAKLGVVQDER